MAVRCPKCHERDIRRSHRRLFDFLLRSIGMVPLRCNICEHRFFRFRKSLRSLIRSRWRVSFPLPALRAGVAPVQAGPVWTDAHALPRSQSNRRRVQCSRYSLWRGLAR